MNTTENNNASINSDDMASRLARLKSFLDSDPDNLSLLAEISDLGLATGEYDISRSAIQHALALEPTDPFFQLRLSTLALSENKLEESLLITEGLLAKGHKDAPIRFNHAFALISLNRHEEAKDILSELFNESADFPTLPHLLIRAHHYLGEIDEAIGVAQKHLETHPEDGGALGMLSLLYFDNDDLEQAKKYADRALKFKPDDLDALIAAGGSELGFENTDESKTLLNRALEIQPKQGRAWVTLGLIDLLGSDLKAAQEKLEKAVEYMPDHIGSWHVLAWAQLLQNDILGAESSFQKALTLDENFGETHGGLAVIAAMRGEWDKAAELSKIAKRLSPESMSPFYAQILRLQHEGRAESAQKIIETVLKNNKMPGGSTLFEFLGRHIKK